MPNMSITLQPYVFIFVIIIIVFVFFVIIFIGWFLLTMSYFNVPSLNKVINKSINKISLNFLKLLDMSLRIIPLVTSDNLKCQNLSSIQIF